MFAPQDNGQPAAALAAATIGDRFGRIYSNPFDVPDVQGVRLDFDLVRERRSARLEAARTDMTEARPGDQIMVETVIRPYRGERLVRQIPIRIPTSTSKGTLRILVSDGDTLDRMHRGTPMMNRGLGLAPTIALLNRERANDRVYVSRIQSDPEAMVADKVMPTLPLSVMNVMENMRGTQDMVVLGESSVSEQFRNPATGSYSRSIANTAYTQGLYSYQDTAGNLHQVNLFQIAGSGNSSLPTGTRAFPTTIDPIVAQTYSQIAALTAGAALVPNSGNGDYNSSTFNYQVGGMDARDFWTARFDYNVTQKHHLSFTYDYDKYNSIPDLLNNVVPVYPGTGTILGTTVNTGQASNRFVGTLALRSALSSRLTNELRAGLNGGTVLFFPAIAPGLFSEWRGYAPSITYGAIYNNSNSRSPQRRNGPYKEVGDNLSYVKGSHQITVGFTWSQVQLWQSITGTESIPSISFGLATGDLANTGASAPFNIAANFPGASSSQISTGASDWANQIGRPSC